MPTAWQLPAPTRPTNNTLKIWADQQQPDGSIKTVAVNPSDVVGPSGALMQAGGTMSGTLTLAGNPTSGLQAATKAYVDAAAPVTSVAGKVGSVVLTHNDISDWASAVSNLGGGGGGGGAVASVAGKTGVVTLVAADISNFNSAVAALSPVTSVASRTGAVTLTHNDITDWASATTGFGGTQSVLSVAGKTGTVTLVAADISNFGTVAAAAAPVQTVAGRSGSVTLSAADISNFATTAAAAAPVQSVAGRTGAVTLTSADISNFGTAVVAASPVVSVAGRTGTITLSSTDISGFGAAAAAAAPVTTVAGKSGMVTLVASDLSNFNVAAAAAAPVQTVAGRTGNVTLSSTDILNFGTAVVAASPVQSIAGKTGTVTLVAADITDFGTAVNAIAAVSSVAGRTGAITLTSSDITNFGTAVVAASPVAKVAGRTGTITLTAADLTDFSTAVAAASAVTSVAGRTGAITLTSADISNFGTAVVAASPVVKVANRTGTITLTSSDLTDFNTAVAAAAPVQTVAGRSGAVTLSASDIANFATTAAAAAPVQTVAGRAGAVTLTAADIANFATTAAAAAPVQTVAGRAGAVTLTHTDITDWATSILQPANNLSELTSPSAARQALGVPINGVAITDPAYGAIDDGLNGYVYATWTTNGTTFTFYSSNVAVTVANTGPGGVALVTVPGATSGNMAAPQQNWAGRPIAITGAGVSGGTFVSVVKKVYFDHTASDVVTLQLADPAPSTLTASVQQLACPCFTSGSDGTGFPSVVGKKLYIANGGKVDGISQLSGGGAPLLFTPFTGTISAYTSPFQVSMTAIPGAAQTTKPAYIEFGTDNSPAVALAGIAALAQNHKALLFNGGTKATSTGRFCLFDWETNFGGNTVQDQINAPAMNALHWISSGASVFITTATGTSGNQQDGWFQSNQMYKTAVPWHASAPPVPKSTIDAAVQWPRCATLSTIVVLILGDSWGNSDPSGQSNPVFGPFVANLMKRNASKTFHFVYSAVNGQTWNAINQNLSTLSTVTVAGSTVTPDLVCFFCTGGNDATAIYRSAIQTAINTVKSWATKNGFPPDICMLTGTYPRNQEKFSATTEERQIPHEYASVLHRSIARSRGYAFVDIARHGAFHIRGWSEDALATRQVLPVANGNAGPILPYYAPYQCRDFYMAIQLGTGGTTGTAFWAAVGTLQVALSPKPDNRLVLFTDASFNLNVMAINWGYTVPTPVTMTNGSASLVTSGQTALTVTSSPTAVAPNFKLSSASTFGSVMVGSCFLAAGTYYANSDYRSYILGYSSGNVAFTCDGTASVFSSPTAQYYGGQMFIPLDASAQVDCIIAGAGSTTHGLTGANSLITTITGYTNYQSVTLAANSQANLSASTQKVFIGSITVKPTYDRALGVGNDASAAPVLTIRKSGTHVRVGYILGSAGATLSDIRNSLQVYEKLVWEGEVEVYGGPFIPKIWCDNSSAMSILYMQIDDRDGGLRRPTLTSREAFGTGDPTYSFMPFGGDTGHPSQLYIANVIDDVSAAQSLAIPNLFDDNFGVTTPTTGFTYAIPANQAFTELTPAGTLASGTITLPSIYQQGGRLEIFSTQTITALTVSAPSGFTLTGNSVTTLAANGTIAFRLVGTNYVRVA